MLALALCAAALELDREARRRPELAPYVPAPARGFAWPALVERALVADDMPLARSSAISLVAARPVAAENLASLAIAANVAGDARLAATALALGAGRSWREPIAQASAAEAAMAAGDWASALPRVAALWSTGSRGPEVAAALNRIIARPAGRSEAVAWLADKRLERDRYLAWGSEVLDPANHGAVVAGAIERGARFDCEELALASQRALTRGSAAGARAMWQGPCAAHGTQTPADFAFVPATRDGGSGPFGWQAVGTGSFVASASGGARPGWSLAYEHPLPGTQTIARRVVALAPGSWRIVIRAARAGSRAGAMKLAIRCIDESGVARDLALIALDEGAATFAIPARGCAVQDYELRAPRGADSIAALDVLRAREPAGAD